MTKYPIVEVTWKYEKKVITQKFVEVNGMLFPFQVSTDMAELPNIQESKQIGELDFIPPMKITSKPSEFSFYGGKL